MTINDGGPAFPNDIEDGISMRAYFAAKAMQGMIPAMHLEMASVEKWVRSTAVKSMATLAWIVADQMIATGGLGMDDPEDESNEDESAPSKDGPLPWWRVLKTYPEATLLEVRDQYLKLRSIYHPDNGGDPIMFQAVQKAWEQAQKVL